MPLESDSKVLSPGIDSVWLFPPSKLIFAERFCSIFKRLFWFSVILF